MREIESRKLDLLGKWTLKVPQGQQFFVYPVVQGAMIFKFECTDRVGNIFKGVGNTMRKVVTGVNGPGVSGAVMLSVFDAIRYRVSQIDIGACHINL